MLEQFTDTKRASKGRRSGHHPRSESFKGRHPRGNGDEVSSVSIGSHSERDLTVDLQSLPGVAEALKATTYTSENQESAAIASEEMHRPEVNYNELVLKAKELQDFEVALDESAMHTIEEGVETSLEGAQFTEILELAHAAHIHGTDSLLIMAENAIIDRVADMAEEQHWSKDEELRYLQQVSDTVYDTVEKEDTVIADIGETDITTSEDEDTSDHKELTPQQRLAAIEPIPPMPVGWNLNDEKNTVTYGPLTAQARLAAIKPIPVLVDWTAVDKQLKGAQATKSHSNPGKTDPLVRLQGIEPITIKPTHAAGDQRKDTAPIVAVTSSDAPLSSTHLNRVERFIAKAKTTTENTLASIREKLLSTPEKKRRTKLVALGLGVVALGAGWAANRYRIDLNPFINSAIPQGNAGGGAALETVTSPSANEVLESRQPGNIPSGISEVSVSGSEGGFTANGGAANFFSGVEGTTDFSTSGMNDFNSWANGQKVERGDSVWKLAERYLEQKGISDPSKYHIDAVKDDIVQNWKSQGLVNGDGTLRANPNDILRVR